MDLELVAEQWRTTGFVVLERYLEPAAVLRACRELGSVFPSAEVFHRAPYLPAHQALAGDEFAGLRSFPFPTVELCQLVIRPELINLAEALLGTCDLRVYAAELWAKYSGAADYNQIHHRDYSNHTPLVPSEDWRWRGLELFIWLNDVTDAQGATRLVPLQVTSGTPAVPLAYGPADRPDFYDHEVSGAGPAGTVVAYSTDTFHRGTEIAAADAARFSAHVSYRRADNEWTGRRAWGDGSSETAWRRFVKTATPRQLELFGFPPAQHPYWTDTTRTGLTQRYPGIDLGPSH